MITSIRFSNYRCFKEVEISLGPVTALVGANGCGKSTVLSALRVGHTLGACDRSAFGGDGCRITFEAGGLLFHRERNANGSYGEGGQWTPRANALQSVRLDLGALRHPNQVEHVTRLEQSGANLTNLFASLSRRQQVAASRRFCDIVPLYSDVEARPHGSLVPGKHTLLFQDRWNERAWYTPTDVSDGTLLMFAFLLLPYQQDPPELVAIEEPERGLHPFLMGQVVDVLRSLTNPATGAPIQVVLATHSAEMLDFLRPEEVRFLSRGSDGSVQVEGVATGDPAWEDAFRKYRNSLGDLWLSGGLGGVPS